MKRWIAQRNIKFILVEQNDTFKILQKTETGIQYQPRD